MKNSINTQESNLVATKLTFPTGVATVYDHQGQIDTATIDGKVVKKGKLQWFPSEHLKNLNSERTKLNRELKMYGFPFMGTYIVHDRHLDIVNKKIDRVTQYCNAQKNLILNHFDSILENYWAQEDVKDVAHLLRRYAMDKSDFEVAFDIQLMPVLKFGSTDSDLLETSLEKAALEAVSVQANAVMKTVIVKGKLKPIIPNLNRFEDLLTLLRNLAVTMPSISVAVDTFKNILSDMPKKDIPAADMTLLIAWVGILNNPSLLSDHLEGINPFDIDAHDAKKRFMDLDLNDDVNVVKAVHIPTPQQSFFDL